MVERGQASPPPLTRREIREAERAAAERAAAREAQAAEPTPIPARTVSGAQVTAPTVHTRPEAHTPGWVPGRRTVGQPPATPNIAVPSATARPEAAHPRTAAAQPASVAQPATAQPTTARPATAQPAAAVRSASAAHPATSRPASGTRAVPAELLVAAAHEMPRVPLESIPANARVLRVSAPPASGAPEATATPAQAADRSAPTTALATVAPAAAERSATLSPAAADATRRTASDAPAASTSRPHVVRLRPAGRHGRTAARFGVVGALAAVTVAVPLSHGSFGGADVLSGLPTGRGSLPSTVSALTGQPSVGSPPASLAASNEVVIDERAIDRVSRNADRETLPGCDPSARAAGLNGQLATDDLCTLWDGHTQLRADAASALAGLNAVYAARFGADMCIVSGYRTLATQYALKAQKGGLAATPGKSNHGWGLAVDLCSDMTSGDRWEWLNENAGIYGFENPAWAQEGGSGPYERWHWEYLKGVMADGEYYGS